MCGRYIFGCVPTAVNFSVVVLLCSLCLILKALSRFAETIFGKVQTFQFTYYTTLFFLEDVSLTGELLCIYDVEKKIEKVSLTAQKRKGHKKDVPLICNTWALFVPLRVLRTKHIFFNKMRLIANVINAEI